MTNKPEEIKVWTFEVSTNMYERRYNKKGELKSENVKKDKTFISTDDVTKMLDGKIQYLDWIIHMVDRIVAMDNKGELLTELKDSLVLNIEKLQQIQPKDKGNE